MAKHVAHIARRTLVEAKDFIGPRNYHYWIGENPPRELVEAFKKGIHYAPKAPVIGFHKGRTNR